MRALKTLLTAIAFVALVACHGADEVTQQPQYESFIGTWDVELRVFGGTLYPYGAIVNRVLIINAQSGWDVSGVFTDAAVTTTFTGNYSPDANAITFAISQAEPCVGAFSGSSEVNADFSALTTGNYGGEDCNGTVGAYLEATKR